MPMAAKEKPVALIAPNTLGFYKFSGKNRENLALGMLGSYLEQHAVPFELIDARLDHLDQETVMYELVKIQPLLVGITLMGQEPAIWSGPLIRMIREELPRTHITTGSYFPTLDPKKAYEIMPEMDSIVLGEGEETLLDLTNCVKQGGDWRGLLGVAYKHEDDIRLNQRRPLIQNLDNLPFPLRYSKGDEVSKLSLEGSRGCIGKCVFCTIGPLYDPNKRVWRGKSPKRVVAELMDLRRRYPDVHQFRFVDADVIGTPSNASRMEELSQELLTSGFTHTRDRLFFETQSRNALSVSTATWERLHQAGLFQVFIGIENGTTKVKQLIGKASNLETDLKAYEFLRSLGINVTYGFIMINPWSELDDIRQNVAVLRQLGNAGLDKYFSELILTPGTRAYQMVERDYGITIDKVDGVDMYSYPLNTGVESLRRVGRRMLENKLYKSFLEQIAAQYTKADSLGVSGFKDTSVQLRNSLDILNYEIFSDILNQAEANEAALSSEQIDSILDKIILQYSDMLQSIATAY